MTILLPILFFVVGVGLYARKITYRVWLAIAVWIALVIGLNYVKPVNLTVQLARAIVAKSSGTMNSAVEKRISGVEKASSGAESGSSER